MLGMIKKDLFMIKNNYKTIIVALLIFVFYSIFFEMNMTFFLPLMGLMVFISTINYDEYNNWYTYATTLPQGKVKVVKSKYLTAIGVSLFLVIIGIILSLIIDGFSGTIKIDDFMPSIMVELFSIIFMMSFLFPMLFKFGAEKGRIVMIIFGLLIVGIVMLLTNVIDIKPSKNLINFIESYFLILSSFCSILMLKISYNISKKIYLKREF